MLNIYNNDKYNYIYNIKTLAVTVSCTYKKKRWIWVFCCMSSSDLDSEPILPF